MIKSDKNKANCEKRRKKLKSNQTREKTLLKMMFIKGKPRKFRNLGLFLKMRLIFR